MTRVLVLYYSSYGHVEAMAEAVAEGARSVDGTEVDIKRVPELVPEEIAKKANMKLDQRAPVAAAERSSPTTTPSSSARRRASATCARRCATSSTRPAGCG